MEERTRRWAKRALLGLGVAFVVLASVTIHRIGSMADRLVLRMACPTVFVESRSLDIAMDKLRTLGLLPVDVTRFVSVELDETAGRMSATAFGLITQTAVYYPGEGCVLQ